MYATIYNRNIYVLLSGNRKDRKNTKKTLF